MVKDKEVIKMARSKNIIPLMYATRFPIITYRYKMRGSKGQNLGFSIPRSGFIKRFIKK